MGWGMEKVQKSDCSLWHEPQTRGVDVEGSFFKSACLSSSDLHLKLWLHCLEFREGSSIKSLAQEVQLPLQISFLHLLICRTAGNSLWPCQCKWNSQDCRAVWLYGQHLQLKCSVEAAQTSGSWWQHSPKISSTAELCLVPAHEPAPQQTWSTRVTLLETFKPFPQSNCYWWQWASIKGRKLGHQVTLLQLQSKKNYGKAGLDPVNA